MKVTTLPWLWYKANNSKQETSDQRCTNSKKKTCCSYERQVFSTSIKENDRVFLSALPVSYVTIDFRWRYICNQIPCSLISILINDKYFIAGCRKIIESTSRHVNVMVHIIFVREVNQSVLPKHRQSSWHSNIWGLYPNAIGGGNKLGLNGKERT